jgi:protein TonB
VFADSLLDFSWADRSRRGWTTAASFALEAIVVGGFLLLPLLYTQGLPQIRSMASLIAPAPPPAPPALTHVQNTHEATSNMSLEGRMVAPRFIPHEIVQLEETSAPPPPDIAGTGVPGGTGSSRLLTGVFGSTGSGTNVLPPPPPVPAAHAPRVSRMMEGNLIYRMQPQYPALARLARVQGIVVLRAVITREGKIANLQVISGSPMLVQSAMDAVLQWRYRPYYLNNEPVEVETQVTVKFTLAGGS